MEAKIVRFIFLSLLCIPLVLTGILLTFLTSHQFWLSGRGFPKETQLQYDTGFLKSRYDKKECGSRCIEHYTVPILTKRPNTAHGQSYHCDYNYGVLRKRCFDNDNLPLEYRNKSAKIGYYIQPNFLWFKDNNKQLVTLEIDGKMIIDYATTQQKINNYGVLDIILALSALSLLIYSIYFAIQTFTSKEKIINDSNI